MAKQRRQKQENKNNVINLRNVKTLIYRPSPLWCDEWAKKLRSKKHHWVTSSENVEQSRFFYDEINILRKHLRYLYQDLRRFPIGCQNIGYTLSVSLYLHLTSHLKVIKVQEKVRKLWLNFTISVIKFCELLIIKFWSLLGSEWHFKLNIVEVENFTIKSSFSMRQHGEPINYYLFVWKSAWFTHSLIHFLHSNTPKYNST